MKLYTNKKGTLLVGLSLMAVMGVPALAWAQTTEESSTSTDSSLRQEAKVLRDEMQQQREEKKQQAKETRDAKRVAMCEKRKANIEGLMTRIDSRSQHTYKRLGKISELVQAFYEKKELSIEKYDTLVADVNQKKVAAKASLDTMLTHKPFTCDAENPRESVKDYRADRQAKVTAMKAYRQSVRTLLTEVKKAAVTTQEPSTSTDGDAS